MKKVLGGAALLFFAATAGATDFSYSYIQADAFEAKDSERDLETSGAGVTLSVQGQGGGFVRFDFEYGDVDTLRDVSVSDRDLRSVGVLFGGARQQTEKLSLWTGAGIDYTEVETDITTAEIFTYSLDLGARYWLIPRVELNASIGAVFDDINEPDLVNGFDDDDTDVDARAAVGLRFYPLKRLSLGASASGRADGRTERYDVDLRWDY